MDAEWSIFRDNEAGPGWDWCISIPGREPIMGLPEDVARRVVIDHNRNLPMSCERCGKPYEACPACFGDGQSAEQK